MNSERDKYLQSAIRFCNAFSQGKEIEHILSLFSDKHPISAIEHGDPHLAPFLGREFEGRRGIKNYFQIIESLLAYENVQFSEYVVDAMERKVGVKGKGRFIWKSTGKGWDEVFAYVLDFDEDGKVVRYQIWSDTGSAYLASRE